MTRKTEVLLVGVSPASVVQRIAHELQSKYPDWKRPTTSVTAFADAARLLPQRPKLDVIFVANDLGLSAVDMLEGCNALGRAIQMHPNQPWVCVSLGCMASFADVFTIRGLEARHDHLENVIQERANTRPGG